MTLKQALKKHQSKRCSVSCKNGKYYHYFRKQDELTKLANLEVIDTRIDKITQIYPKARVLEEPSLVIDTEQALKVLGKEKF